MAIIHVCDECGAQLKNWRDDHSRQFEALHPEKENMRLRLTLRIEMAFENPPGEWDSIELCAPCVWTWFRDILDDMTDTAMPHAEG